MTATDVSHRYWVEAQHTGCVSDNSISNLPLGHCLQEIRLVLLLLVDFIQGWGKKKENDWCALPPPSGTENLTVYEIFTQIISPLVMIIAYLVMDFLVTLLSIGNIFVVDVVTLYFN